MLLCIGQHLQVLKLVAQLCIVLLIVVNICTSGVHNVHSGTFEFVPKCGDLQVLDNDLLISFIKLAKQLSDLLLIHTSRAVVKE